MRILNFDINRKKPNQSVLGRSNNVVGSYNRMGLGFSIDEFNLFSQIKDYRTDLLNGTNWRASNPINQNDFKYNSFLKLLSKYSTAIFNDFVTVGHVIFARIDGQLFYISQNNYTKTVNNVSVHGYPNAEIFEFDEPNVFSGELSIYWKCKPYQNLYNIALSCQKNGMSKSGFVNILSPKAAAGLPMKSILTDKEKLEIEKTISNSHGVATDDQANFLIFQQGIDVSTIYFDFAKLGILETKNLCEEYVCSKLGVPHILLPSSGQTFSNYEEANKILYENHSKYCEYFCNFSRNELGFDIDYETIAEDEKGIDNMRNEPLNGAQISSLLEIFASVSGGLISKDGAVGIITSSFPNISEDQANKMLIGVRLGVSEAVNAPSNQKNSTL